MLFECAVGDAYGFGFEYADENLPKNDLSRYVKHPTYGQNLKPGMYTDDTQMSLAVAEHLLEGVTFETKKAWADRFLATFKRDPRDGYARHFQAVLENVSTGDELLHLVGGNSNKSGAAMRAGPIGYCRPWQRVVELADVQASVTHDTLLGREAACAAALMTHYFLYEEAPKKLLGKYVNIRLDEREGVKRVIDWNEPWSGPVGANGYQSVRAAITAVAAHDSLHTLLRACVAYSGDVDTVSAIALSAASCSKEYAKTLPTPLVLGLENGPYGRDYLIKIDERLLALRTP